MPDSPASEYRESTTGASERPGWYRALVAPALKTLLFLIKTTLIIFLGSSCLTVAICSFVPMQLHSRVSFVLVAAVQVPCMVLLAFAFLLMLDRYRRQFWVRGIRRKLASNRRLSDDDLCRSLPECDPQTATQIRQIVATQLGIDARLLRPQDNFATLADESIAIRIWMIVNKSYFADEYIVQYAPCQPWIALTLESLIRSVDLKRRVLDSGPTRHIDFEQAMLRAGNQKFSVDDLYASLAQLNDRKIRDLQEMVDASTGCLPKDIYGRIAVGLLSAFFLTLSVMATIGIISSVDGPWVARIPASFSEIRWLPLLVLASLAAFICSTIATCSMGVVSALAAPRCLIKPTGIAARCMLFSMLTTIACFIIYIMR